MSLNLVKSPRPYVSLFNSRFVYRKHHFLRPSNTYLKLNNANLQLQSIRTSSKLIATSTVDTSSNLATNAENRTAAASSDVTDVSQSSDASVPLINSLGRADESTDQYKVTYEEKFAYFSKLSNLIGYTIDELKNANLLTHDYEKKYLEKTLSNLNQSTFVAKLNENIRKKPEIEALVDYFRHRTVLYDCTPKEKALIYRLNSLFMFITKKPHVVSLESYYYLPKFSHLLDLNDHLNYTIGFWKNSLLSRMMVRQNSAIVNDIFELSKKAIVNELRPKTSSSSQTQEETNASLATNEETKKLAIDKKSSLRVEDKFSDLIFDNQLMSAYQLFNYIDLLITEDAHASFYKELILGKENLIYKTNDLDAFLAVVLMRANFRQRVKTYDYFLDSKIDNLIKERRNFIFDNLDKLKNLNLLKDFISFYQRLFMVREKLDPVSHNNLNQLKELFYQHFAPSLKRSHLQLEGARAELSIIENFYKLENSSLFMSDLKPDSNSEHIRRIVKSIDDSTREEKRSSSLYTIKDRELLNGMLDTGLNSLRLIEFVELDRKRLLIEKEYQNGEKLCNTLDKTISNNMDRLCDFRTLPAIVTVCSDLAKKNPFYFKTKLANTILYDAYHRAFSNKSHFYVKFNYLFQNMEFFTEKIELIKPHIPQWVRYNKIEFILKSLVENESAFKLLRESHRNDYMIFLRSLLKRMNTELKLTDYDIINYTLETNQSGEVNMESFNLEKLNSQMLSKKSLKDLNELVMLYKRLDVKDQLESVEPRNLTLDNRSFMIGMRNLIDNTTKVFRHLKKTRRFVDRQQNGGDNVSVKREQMEELKIFFSARFESVVEQLKVTALIYKLNMNQDEAKTLRFLSYFNSLSEILLDNDLHNFISRKLILKMMLKMFNVTKLFNMYQLDESHQNSAEFHDFKAFNSHIFEKSKEFLTLKYLIDLNYTFLNTPFLNQRAIRKLLTSEERLPSLSVKSEDLSYNQKLFLINQKICIKYGDKVDCPFAFDRFGFNYGLLSLESSKELKKLHKYLCELLGPDVIKLDPTYDYNLRANFELMLDKYGNFLSPNDRNYAYKLPIIYLNKNMTYENQSAKDRNHRTAQPTTLYANLINMLEMYHPVTTITSAELNECKTDEEIFKHIKEKIVNSIKKLTRNA